MSKSLNIVRSLAENKEFDILVKVLKIFQKDDWNDELRIKDTSNQMWLICVQRNKFGVIKAGDIVRIRSVKVNHTTKRNVLETTPQSNILKFTAKSGILREMRDSIPEETLEDKMMLDDANEILLEPIFYTEITSSKMNEQPLFRLDDLFLNYDDIPYELRLNNSFRVRFFALRIDPQDPREVV